MFSWAGKVCQSISYNAQRKAAECVQLKNRQQLPFTSQNPNGFRHLAGFADRYLSDEFPEDSLPALPTSHFSGAAWVSRLFMITQTNDNADEPSPFCKVTTGAAGTCPFSERPLRASLLAACLELFLFDIGSQIDI